MKDSGISAIEWMLITGIIVALIYVFVPNWAYIASLIYIIGWSLPIVIALIYGLATQIYGWIYNLKHNKKDGH